MGGKKIVLSNKLKRSVVEVTTQYGLTTSAYSANEPADTQWYYNKGVGFLFGTNKSIVVPSSLVLISPQLLANNNRFPFVSATQAAPTGTIPDTTTQVSRISVAVLVEKSCHRVKNYDCELVSVDPLGETAIIQIKGNEHKFKEEEVLSFVSNNNDAQDEQDIYSYSQETGIIKGILSKKAYCDAQFDAEHILTNLNVPVNYAGLPVVNSNCNLLGIINYVNHGPSSDFFTYSVRAMLYNSYKDFRHTYDCKYNDCDNLYKNKIKDRFTAITDVVGSYTVFRKAYLGILWTPVDYNTFTTNTNPATGAKTPIVSGNVLTSVNDTQSIGIQVSTLAGNTTVTYETLPGATAVAPFPALVNSQLLASLSPEDIIVRFGNKHGAGIPGAYIPGIAPGRFTWVINPNRKTDIIYRSKSTNFSESVTIRDVKLASVFIPLALEYLTYMYSLPSSAPGAIVNLPYKTAPL